MNEMNWMDESCGWQSKRDAKIERLTKKIEHLTKALETLRYDYPTHLSGKAFDIVESALNKEDKPNDD
jgi:hypothetical protein